MLPVLLFSEEITPPAPPYPSSLPWLVLIPELQQLCHTAGWGWAKDCILESKEFLFFNPYKQLLFLFESRWLTVAVSKPVSHCLQKVRGSSPRRTQQQSPQCWRSIQAVLTSHRLKKNFFPLFVCNCAISMVSKKKNQLKTINKQKVVWITRNEVQVNTVVFVFKQTSRWKHDFSKATGR